MLIRLHSVESGNGKVFHFHTQQGHCDRHNACHTPGVRMACNAFHSIKAVSARSATCGWAYRPVGINSKGTMPPVGHTGTPNSLWLCYQPRFLNG